MYKVTISKAMNGYIAEVGCQTLVFETEGKLINELTRYLNNPDMVEREYQELYGPKPTSPQRGDVVAPTEDTLSEIRVRLDNPSVPGPERSVAPD